MKTYNKILLTLGAVCTLAMGACTGDLDLEPTDPNSIMPGSDKLVADKLMAGVMLNFAAPGVNGNGPISIDNGFGTFSRALWSLECVPTDEAYWYTGDADYANFCFNQWTTENGIVKGCYNRLWVNIGLCNQFIQAADNDEFANSNPAQVAEYVRQCKILRGVCYYYLIDLFGNVPWAPFTMEIGEDKVPQLTRAEVFANITAELEAVVAEYANNATQQYGYVGLEVAEAYLSKYYLNAEVYTGTPMWQKAIDYSERIIARHKGTGFEASDGIKTGLNPGYHQLFSLNNKTLCNGGGGATSEIIWSLPQDADHLQTYANSTSLMVAWQAPSSALNLSQSQWNCAAIRPEAAKLFDWYDASGNFTADLNQGYTSNDIRTKWWGTVKDGCDYSQMNYGKTAVGNGYAPIKYTNWYVDVNGNIDANAIQPAATTFASTDFVVVRLAEMYLNAAEAKAKLGQTTDALKYLNYIRERAGADTFFRWSDDDLLDERCRELSNENVRRTDLVRNNKWITGYNWAWKAGSYEGANLPAGYNLYPIPKSVMDLNPDYRQNQGYN